MARALPRALEQVGTLSLHPKGTSRSLNSLRSSTSMGNLVMDLPSLSDGETTSIEMTPSSHAHPFSIDSLDEEMCSPAGSESSIRAESPPVASIGELPEGSAALVEVPSLDSNWVLTSPSIPSTARPPEGVSLLTVCPTPQGLAGVSPGIRACRPSGLRAVPQDVLSRAAEILGMDAVGEMRSYVTEVTMLSQQIAKDIYRHPPDALWNAAIDQYFQEEFAGLATLLLRNITPQSTVDAFKAILDVQRGIFTQEFKEAYGRMVLAMIRCKDHERLMAPTKWERRIVKTVKVLLWLSTPALLVTACFCPHAAIGGVSVAAIAPSSEPAPSDLIASLGEQGILPTDLANICSDISLGAEVMQSCTQDALEQAQELNEMLHRMVDMWAIRQEPS